MDTLPGQTLSQTIIPRTYSSKGPFVISVCPPALFPIRKAI